MLFVSSKLIVPPGYV